MAKRQRRQRVAVVTGTRAEFGLLRPVMRAIQNHPRLELNVIAAGSHLLPPARTVREVERAFAVAARVAMQRPGARRTRAEDASDVGRGVIGFARAFDRIDPDWVLVLGDRIEAFAAGAAASIGGRALCHVHGGDRAEGIADESMRHALSKMAHLHCAATAASAARLVRMGEDPARVLNTGSPAIDGLAEIAPMSDADAAELGDPQAVILMHPSGLSAERERRMIHSVMYGIEEMSGGNVLCLAPNADAGREVVAEAIRTRCARTSFEVSYRVSKSGATLVTRPGKARAPVCGLERTWTYVEHLPRERFIALLKRLAPTEESVGGLLAGNSSAGLIEAAALGVRVLNVGPRQDGRERGDTVVDVPEADLGVIGTKVDWALSPALPQEGGVRHPYGDGHAGERIAAALAGVDGRGEGLLRKRNVY